MGMFNEIYKKCPKCDRRCEIQIQQVVLGFGGFNLEFDLDNPNTIVDELNKEEFEDFYTAIKDEVFWCEKCQHSFKAIGGFEYYIKKDKSNWFTKDINEKLGVPPEFMKQCLQLEREATMDKLTHIVIDDEVKFIDTPEQAYFADSMIEFFCSHILSGTPDKDKDIVSRFITSLSIILRKTVLFGTVAANENKEVNENDINKN